MTPIDHLHHYSRSLVCFVCLRNMPIMKHTCCALLAAASILLGSTLAQDEPQPEAPFLPVVNLGYELHRAISFNVGATTSLLHG
jgi:hypothetical protein